VIHFCMGNESVCPVQCMSTALASHHNGEDQKSHHPSQRDCNFEDQAL
jgi:hypothetical protein